MKLSDNSNESEKYLKYVIETPIISTIQKLDGCWIQQAFKRLEELWYIDIFTRRCDVIKVYIRTCRCPKVTSGFELRTPAIFLSK